MRFLLTLLTISLLLTSTTHAQQRRKREPKNKIGALYSTLMGTKYELTNKTSGNVNSGKFDDESDPIVGAVFFYERIFSSIFAVGFRATTFLERQMELTVGTETVNVVEKSTMMAFDFKTYYKEHSARGIKPYFGVGLGTLNVTSDLSVASSAATSSTSATIPITFLTVGTDYKLESAGFRLEIGSTKGERNDLEDNDMFNAKYEVTGLMVNAGVYLLF